MADEHELAREREQRNAALLMALEAKGRDGAGVHVHEVGACGLSVGCNTCVWLCASYMHASRPAPCLSYDLMREDKDEEARRASETREAEVVWHPYTMSDPHGMRGLRHP